LAAGFEVTPENARFAAAPTQVICVVLGLGLERTRGRSSPDQLSPRSPNASVSCEPWAPYMRALEAWEANMTKGELEMMLADVQPERA
jgi:hypothetical protein